MLEGLRSRDVVVDIPDDEPLKATIFDADVLWLRQQDTVHLIQGGAYGSVLGIGMMLLKVKDFRPELYPSRLNDITFAVVSSGPAELPVQQAFALLHGVC